MDINRILKPLECSCGKTHTCDIEYVYIENNAISRLDKLCSNNKNILLVADENTFSAAGEKVVGRLSGKNIKKVIFSGKTVLIPDENAIEKVTSALCKTDLIIGIGSGVIQDLCKYVSFFNKIPYIIVATAPSMDGYASNGAAMILKGMKETVAAGLPKAIIADTCVLKDAPLEMIKAGYGDIIGKYSALCDWKLSRAVNEEYFCQYIYDTTYTMIEDTLKLADGLLSRNEESIRILMKALTVVGIMMSFAGSSRPASGSEHHLSHFFEITGIVKDEPYFPHGIDVAYSTIITTAIREQLVKATFPDTKYTPDRQSYINKMDKVYGKVAPGCIALQDRLETYTKDRMPVYKAKETEIRNILSDIPSSNEIKAMLAKVGLDISKFYEMYGDKKIQDAIYYAKDLKDRYTVLWLKYDIFGESQNKGDINYGYIKD